MKDTVILIILPGEVQIDSVEIPCPPPPPIYIPDTARVETEFAYSLAWFDKNFIKIKLVQKKSELEVRLENALKESYYWKSQYEQIVITLQPIKYIPKIYKIALWMWIGVIATLVLFVIIKFGLKKFL